MDRHLSCRLCTPVPDGEGVRHSGRVTLPHSHSVVCDEISVSRYSKMPGHGLVPVATFAALGSDPEFFHGAVIVRMAITKR